MSELIESLYCWLADRGQAAQLAADFSTSELAAAFAATVSDVSKRPAAGAFYPPGRRRSLHALAQERAAHRDRISDTRHVQVLLCRARRCEVQGDRSLDFEFVDYELTPMSSAGATRRVWLTDDRKRRISLDALLVNAKDRTPIVAEIKIGGDQNLAFALVQALAAAAQLSSESQLHRLHDQYRDALGEIAPTRLDVCVIAARAPVTGVRPQLAQRARERARALIETGALSAWIRRIAFLEITVANGVPVVAIYHDSNN